MDGCGRIEYRGENLADHIEDAASLRLAISAMAHHAWAVQAGSYLQLGSGHITFFFLRLPAVGTLKGYSKALEYEYRVKTAALGTLKRYSILSLTLYLE
jgi:hypothetical protein